MEVSLNSTIFIQMIGFLILLFILNFILYKPVLKTIAQRKEAIDDLLKQANTLKAKAKENENTYLNKIKEAEKQAKEEYNAIVTSAIKEKEKRINEETERARQMIETEKTEIFKVLDKESKNIKHYSEEISQKIYDSLVA